MERKAATQNEDFLVISVPDVRPATSQMVVSARSIMEKHVCQGTPYGQTKQSNTGRGVFFAIVVPKTTTIFVNLENEAFPKILKN